MVRCGGLLIRTQVTADAVGRKSLAVELPHGSNLVAGVTVHGRVSADQRKTVLVLVDGMDRDLPTIDSVTHVALRAVSAPVDVGVTVLAIAARIGKDRIDVALLAPYSHVHSTQGIPGLVVIKLRVTASRLPGRQGVAVPTISLQGTMWVPGGRGRTGVLPGWCTRHYLNHQEHL